MRVALYLRVSTSDQNCENQAAELRRYVAARGWTVAGEYADTMSGARDSRPALDELQRAILRRQVDGVVVWSLDRLGRNMRHLVTTLQTWDELGVAFVSLREGLDYTTAAGRLYVHVMAALAAFERERTAERIRAWQQRARAAGEAIGRPRVRLTVEQLREVEGLSVRAAGERLGVSRSVVHRSRLSQKVA